MRRLRVPVDGADQVPDRAQGQVSVRVRVRVRARARVRVKVKIMYRTVHKGRSIVDTVLSGSRETPVQRTYYCCR